MQGSDSQEMKDTALCPAAVDWALGPGQLSRLQSNHFNLLHIPLCAYIESVLKICFLHPLGKFTLLQMQLIDKNIIFSHVPVS